MFSLFFAPLEDVISNHGMNCMMYADDTQIYVSINSCSDRSAVLSKLELCVKDILIWCASNGLSCNADETEVIHITSRYAKRRDPFLGITVGDAVIAPKLTVRDLVVTVDSHLQFTEHVNSICRSVYLATSNIGKIQKHLAQDDCKRSVHAFITSKLDSCNSILYGLPACQFEKLQRVQNTAARLVTREGKFEHISPILHKQTLATSKR